jgi:hypothetical protein
MLDPFCSPVLRARLPREYRPFLTRHASTLSGRARRMADRVVEKQWAVLTYRPSGFAPGGDAFEFCERMRDEACAALIRYALEQAGEIMQEKVREALNELLEAMEPALEDWAWQPELQALLDLLLTVERIAAAKDEQ